MQICSAIRPAIRSAISAAIISAFCARAVAGPLLGQLFPLTAPGVTNPGYALDYSDLTEEKLSWRRNQLTETEFRNGLTDFPVRGGLVTASTLSGFAGAVAFGYDGTTQSYAYKQFTQPVGVTFTFSVFVVMDDGGAPVIAANDFNTDFRIRMAERILTFAEGNYVVQAVPGMPGVYRVSVTYTRTTTAGIESVGVVKSAPYTSRTFKVTGYQIDRGPITPYQALTDVSAEFLAAYPYHSLFRDNLGTVACFQLEDPCGLALDMRFGGARSLERFPNGDLSNGGTNWVVTGADATHVVTFADGTMRYRSDTVTPALIASSPLAVQLVVGTTYEITADVVSVTGAGLATDRFAIGGPVIAGVGRTSRKAVCTSTGPMNLYRSGSNVDITLRSISVKEVFGNHAVQATAGDRPFISSKYNQLPNSAWQGGGAIPTGWTQPVAAATTATAGVDGNSVYRFPAAAARAFFAAPLVSLVVGQVMSLGVTVEAIASGSVPAQDTVIFAPSSGAGTNAFYADGVLVAASAPVAVGQRVVCVTTCTTAGTFIPRAGAGCSGNATVDISLSRPAVTAGGVASVGRYQRTNADGTYDYAGFLIGARGNGINSSMSIPSLNLSASQRAILASAVMKMGDATRGIVQEHTGTASNSGSFNIEGPFGPNQGNFRFALSGSPGNGAPASSLVSGYPAPALAVLQSSLDTSQAAVADAVRSRVNGVEAGSKSGSTGGTANLANDAHYLWRRGSTTGVNFDGFIYRAICRGGDFDAATNSLADRWLNERVKAFA